jgi:pimeloyl-ACP methyl ester carboxylesterase
MIEDGPGRIDYDESGNGATIMLAPGSCSTGAAWRPILSQWEDGFRCVTTSLLGYGGTAERRTSRDADISHEAEILEAVIRRAAGPVHLVGHSFGGLTALAVALRNKVPLLSLIIAEAPAPEILRHTGEQLYYRAFREMTDSSPRSAPARPPRSSGWSTSTAARAHSPAGRSAFAITPWRPQRSTFWIGQVPMALR